MNFKKVGLVAILLIGLLHTQQVKAAEAEPSIYGNYGIVMDADTGEVLFDKNSHGKWYPASLTKVMTAIMLEENVKDGQEIPVSANASSQEGSNSYFKLTPGETISKENALYAMMVISANDAAAAVGEYIGGTTENYAKMMTQRAHDLGANDSNFVTANGLHDPNHYSTAYDLALITRYAIKYPDVIQAMGTKQVTIKTNKQETLITNPSRILDNPLAIGGKPGYTDQSQNNLIEVLKKDGHTIIAVVMKSSLSQEYSDIDTMANYAFSKENNSPMQTLYTKGSVMQTSKINGQDVGLVIGSDVNVPSQSGQKPNVTTKITLEQKTGDIKQGDKIGEMEIDVNGTKMNETFLLSDRDITATKTSIPKSVQSSESKSTNSPIWKKILFGIAIPIPFYVWYLVQYNKRKRKENV